jgi:hypothetical protein
MYETRSNLEEVYVMGNRLLAFLKHALPRHGMFAAAESHLRVKRRQDLEWIRNRLEVIALRIDEEEWNQFILRDLDSSVQKIEGRRSERRPLDIEQWENFSGWSMIGEADFSWEQAHGVSFESSEFVEESVDDVEESREEQLVASPEEQSVVHEYVEFDGANDAKSEHSSQGTPSLEAEDYSLWHITAIEESNEDDNQAENGVKDRHDPNLGELAPVLRRSPVKLLSDVISSALKRPQRRDPPGHYFSRINCFASRPQYDFHFPYSDEVGVGAKDEKENETISTAPSDEDDSYPRWKGRVEESIEGRSLLYVPESYNRFRAYSS